MMDMWNLYRDGGSLMHPILGLGLSAIVVGIIGAAMRSRAIAYAALGCVVFCLLHGFGAYYLGMVEVDLAVATIAPDMAQAARERGTEIAQIPMFFALGLAIPGAVAASVAWVRSQTPVKSA